MTLQRQLPGLPDQLRAEHAMLFLLDEAKAGSLIDMAGGGGDRVGPPRPPSASRVLPGPHAIPDQPPPPTPPPPPRVPPSAPAVAAPRRAFPASPPPSRGNAGRAGEMRRGPRA